MLDTIPLEEILEFSTGKNAGIVGTSNSSKPRIANMDLNFSIVCREDVVSTISTSNHLE